VVYPHGTQGGIPAWYTGWHTRMVHREAYQEGIPTREVYQGGYLPGRYTQGVYPLYASLPYPGCVHPLLHASLLHHPGYTSVHTPS